MTLPMLLQNELYEAVKKHDLQDHYESILKLARLKYGLDPCLKKGAIGSTKFGGPPELPIGMKWPSNDEGFLVFVGQINLAELPRLDTFLPRTGLLSFFISTDEPAYNIENRILYINNGEQLTRLQPPSNDEYVLGCMQDYDQPLFGEAWVRTKPCVWIPRYEELEGLSEDQLCNLSDELDDSSSYLLGATSSVIGEPAVDAAIIAAGYSEFLFSPKTPEAFQERIDSAMKDNPDYAGSLLEQQPRHLKFCDVYQRIEDEAKQWNNLLVLDSHSELQMCWWDAGTLNFLGREERIRKSQFDSIYAAIVTS